MWPNREPPPGLGDEGRNMLHEMFCYMLAYTCTVRVLGPDSAQRSPPSVCVLRVLTPLVVPRAWLEFGRSRQVPVGR